MKNLLFSIAFLFATCFAFGQIPPLAFNYSAVARNSQGNPIANSTIGIQVSLLKTSAIGAVQYSENHFINTDAFGLFNLIVGAGAIQQGSMSAIDWSSDNFYMKVGMDANGGTNFLTMGTTQLLSVPYALHAKTADSVTNGAGAVNIQAGNNVTITGAGTSIDPYIVNSTNTGGGNLLAPTVITNNASNITNTSATFNATVNPNSFLTSVTFEYGTTTSYGNYYPTVTNVSGSVNSPISQSPNSNLTPSTTYHYRVKAQNAVDVSYGNDVTFTTPSSGLPIIGTWDSVTTITSNSFRFVKDINPNGSTTTSYCEYGTTSSFGTTLTSSPASISGTFSQSVRSSTVTLIAGVTYYYRFVATNTLGTIYGTTETFTP